MQNMMCWTANAGTAVQQTTKTRTNDVCMPSKWQYIARLFHGERTINGQIKKWGMAKTSLFIVAKEARKGYVMVVVVVVVVIVVVVVGVVVGSTRAPKRCRVYHGFFLLRLFFFLCVFD